MVQSSKISNMSGIRGIGSIFIACLIFILIMGLEVAVVLAKAPEKLNSDFVFAIIGKVFGLWAATLLTIQFVLSSRLKILNKIFGIDKLMIVHRFLGASALIFAILHPLILYHSEFYTFGVLRLSRWPQLLGAAVIILLIAIVCTSIFRMFLKLDYRYWRIIHQFTFVTVVVAAIHAMIIGSEFQSLISKILCVMILLGYAVLFVWVKFIKPRMLRDNPYVVTEVMALNHNVVDLRLKPDKTNLFEYLPGQFAFLRLFRKGLKTEEHPFTISSSPANRDYISFTIKNSGDYTSTIGLTKVGDKATVEAPLGRFSFMLYPRTEHIVFIAGGIGITPLLSMLRYIAQTDNKKRVTLIWANRTVNDTFLPEEFEDIISVMPNLKIHHIMSKQPDYAGLKGYLNEAILKELLNPVLPGARVFLCGPPQMMKLVKGSLRNIGFAKNQIITENFAL